ncbi:MAG: hypothetical protein Tsb0010_07150 [Parvularculaceae bacterium]
MKNGVDLNELAERLREASPAERKRILDAYGKWIRDGAQVAALRVFASFLLFIASALLISIEINLDTHRVVIYVAAALSAAVGARLLLDASRREREWREANPFQY